MTRSPIRNSEPSRVGGDSFGNGRDTGIVGSAADGTIEAWARSTNNPVGGWYGQRKGYRGRFGMYLPPLLEHLGHMELEHNPRNNRARAR